ncbi:nuclear transport factor 2 family protein [Alteromonas sp. KUL49]|uniref:nuclear transport factor 2 family protein n=1 Tax=Alteromonas sp. KUL49 TaxID=2480798 RepID=UPI00102F0EAD|nr:nuclear transport factor 2 family protein [Alteromonas sp. KUL49]
MITYLIRSVFVICGVVATSNCFASTALTSTVNEYFEVYQQRKDFNSFMAFYSENAVLKDVVYELEVAGKGNIAEFFDWSRGSFSAAGDGPILSVNSHFIDGNSVVTRGVFHRFSFNGKEMGPWDFIILQRFDQHGLIEYQEDWINYSPKQIQVGE